MKNRLCCKVILAVAVLSLPASSSGDLQEDLAAVVTKQKQQRQELVSRQVETIKQLKRERKPAEAKTAQKLLDDLKANRRILFPHISVYDRVGHLEKGRVVGVEENYYVIEASIGMTTQKQETTMVPGPRGLIEVGTGRFVVIWEPKQLALYTTRTLDLGADVSEIPCRLEIKDQADGDRPSMQRFVVTELSSDEIKAALQELKKR